MFNLALIVDRASLTHSVEGLPLMTRELALWALPLRLERPTSPATPDINSLPTKEVLLGKLPGVAELVPWTIPALLWSAKHVLPNALLHKPLYFVV